MSRDANNQPLAILLAMTEREGGPALHEGPVAGLAPHAWVGRKVGHDVLIKRALQRQHQRVRIREVTLRAKLRPPISDIPAGKANSGVQHPWIQRGNYIPSLADEQAIIRVLLLPVRMPQLDTGAVLSNEVAMKIDLDFAAA
jgi:hypothetical protein